MAQEFKTLQELFADPSRWTQRVSARDSEGLCPALDPDDPRAVCWCLVGGARLVYSDGNLRTEIYRRLRSALPSSDRTDTNKWQLLDDFNDLVSWNDNYMRTPEEILELVTKAGV